MVCKYRIVFGSVLSPALAHKGRRWLCRLLSCFLLVGCATPPPAVPAGSAATYPDELRYSITALSWVVDDARRAGLLDLARQPDEAVRRRQELHAFLARFDDALRSVDALARYYDDQPGQEAFLLRYTAELAIYLNLAELMDATVGVAQYETVFSEERPELGLRAGTWKELKNAFNLQPWQRPLGLYQLRHDASLGEYRELGIDQKRSWALGYIEDHHADIVRHGIATGPEVFSKDVLARLTDGFHWVWFPAQKSVAEGMGDTRVVDGDRRLISDEQVARATALLRPGDVIVERRNWYLSNIGLPGFWPHTALYVGTRAEVRAEFGDEFLAGLERGASEASKAWSARDRDGHVLRILEAVSEGVVWSSTEHSLGADFAAAIRPNLDRAERGALLRNAFAYFGRPYDFDFDFRSDDTIVCSELVYKAYEAAAPAQAKRIPIATIVGRPVLSPNALVAYYDEHADDEAPPFRFVFYLEGDEAARAARFRDAAALRASHRRDKWDVMQLEPLTH